VSDRIREAAQRIADWHLQDAEFCLIYEDEECEDMTEDEWRQVHDLIQHSRATLPAPESPGGEGQ
jgi:hypothetical protein